MYDMSINKVVKVNMDVQLNHESSYVEGMCDAFFQHRHFVMAFDVESPSWNTIQLISAQGHYWILYFWHFYEFELQQVSQKT